VKIIESMIRRSVSRAAVILSRVTKPAAYISMEVQSALAAGESQGVVHQVTSDVRSSVSQRFYGDLNGYVSLFFPDTSLPLFCNMFVRTGWPVKNNRLIEAEVLQEVGNIIINQVLEVFTGGLRSRIESDLPVYEQGDYLALSKRMNDYNLLQGFLLKYQLGSRTNQDILLFVACRKEDVVQRLFNMGKDEFDGS